MSAPEESFPSDDNGLPKPDRRHVGAVRVSAMIAVVVTVAIGVVVTRSLGAGLLVLLLWFVVVVPAVTLVALFVVDRLRRHR